MVSDLTYKSLIDFEYSITQKLGIIRVLLFFKLDIIIGVITQT